MADWVIIKNEYISTQISTRDLAKKYGVSHSQVARRSSREKWAKQRETLRNETETLCIQKTAEAVSTAIVDRNMQLMGGGDKIVSLLHERLDQISADGKIRSYELKAIAETFKTIRDLYDTDTTPPADQEGDGLKEALDAVACEVCTGEDDSCMLPGGGDDAEEESH